MFNPERCNHCINYKYSQDDPQYVRAAQKAKAEPLADHKFTRHIVGIVREYATELSQVVGPYRLELFYQEMEDRSVLSVDAHVKKNTDKSRNDYYIQEIDPKYFERSYIEDNDFWSIFKETQLEGEFLCSLLSDLA